MNASGFHSELELVDRERWRQELAAPAEEERTRATLRLFVFRAGSEWFGMDPAWLLFAEPLPPVHSVPFRPEGLAGLVNVRGRVTLCFSLAAILQCTPGPPVQRPMMLVLEYAGWQVACRIDEADGIRSFDPGAVVVPPATLPFDRRHVSGMVGDGTRSVAQLDIRLFRALEEVAH